MTPVTAHAGVLTTVIVVNLVYVVLLVLRMLASRRRPVAGPGGPDPVATARVASGQATAVMVAMAATSAVYYIALVVWIVAPEALGAPLTPPSDVLWALGTLSAVAGLVLMGWSYAVFRSWRWRAEVDPGHVLMTGGPFRRVRHPIYASFALFYAGSVLLMPYPVFLVHAVVSFVAYDYRARAEETVMVGAFGDAYRAYRARTRRYFPGLY